MEKIKDLKVVLDLISLKLDYLDNLIQDLEPSQVDESFLKLKNDVVEMVDYWFKKSYYSLNYLRDDIKDKRLK